jgi:hypothetical protein
MQAASSSVGRILPWWPCAVGGAALPILATYLRVWLLPPLAAGVAFVILWALVGMVLSRRPPTASWGLPRWLIGGLVGALVAAVVTYILPSG